MMEPRPSLLWAGGRQGLETTCCFAPLGRSNLWQRGLRPPALPWPRPVPPDALGGNRGRNPPRVMVARSEDVSHLAFGQIEEGAYLPPLGVPQSFRLECPVLESDRQRRGPRRAPRVARPARVNSPLGMRWLLQLETGGPAMQPLGLGHGRHAHAHRLAACCARARTEILLHDLSSFAPPRPVRRRGRSRRPDARTNAGGVVEFPECQVAEVLSVSSNPRKSRLVGRRDRSPLDLKSTRLALKSTSAGRIDCHVEQIWYAPPVAFDPACIAPARAAALAHGLPAREIVSGAGHAAVYMARLAPPAIIFVPSKDGISPMRPNTPPPKPCTDAPRTSSSTRSSPGRGRDRGSARSRLHLSLPGLVHEAGTARWSLTSA